MNGCEQVCVCLCVCVNQLCVCVRACVRALKCGGGNWGGGVDVCTCMRLAIFAFWFCVSTFLT